MAVAVAVLVAVPVAVAVAVLVPVGVLVFVLVPVAVLDAVLVAVGVLVADAVADALWVCEAVSEPEIDHVAVELAVAVEVPVADAVAVLVAVGVDVAVDVAVGVDVAVDVAVAVDVELAVELDSPTVCVSVPRGMTIQLVPSEIARNVPPINSPDVANPMLSAVRSLKMTSPLAAPATYMATSATLTNRFHSPLLTSDAAGNVNVTSAAAPRVVKTEPKSARVTV